MTISGFSRRPADRPRPRLTVLIGTGSFLTLSLLGCSNEVVGTGSSSGQTTGSGEANGGSGGSSSTGSGPQGTIQPLVQSPGVNKIDLLLAIDNSSSMLDKQRILGSAVPDLVNRLVNPICVSLVDASKIQANQPPSPTEPCDAGYLREFQPILDINIGIVDSSLGGLGSDACPDSAVSNNNDHGHLVTRSGIKGNQNDPEETYKSQGFLAWDPTNTRGGITDEAILETTLQDLVLGTGQVGCGYEMQLESWARFLVDPSPYQTITKAGSGLSPTTLTGVDSTLLTQRQDFLRSDSLLAIVQLTDENDCSTIAGGASYAPLMQQPFFKGSSACSDPSKGPSDHCCYSCGVQPPGGCDPDPACVADGKPATYNLIEDNVNLRCWHQKERYGFTGLYPVKRYVNALTQRLVSPKTDDWAGGKTQVANPIFSDLSGKGGVIRDPSLVFYAGIVGVPWQDLAVDANDPGKGFQDYSALTQSGFWAADVGDPDNYVYPTHGNMQEDYHQRSGVPTASANGGDPTAPNGGDRILDPDSPADLQYACVFKLPQASSSGFDCSAGKNPNGDNPLCDGTTQTYAKAYPSLRELAVLNGMGEQGITASVCPSELADVTSASYGYRPAVTSIIQRLRALHTDLNGECLSQPVVPQSNGLLDCVVIEAANAANGQEDCNSIPGRRNAPPADHGFINSIQAEPQAATAGWDSFCEITQVSADSSGGGESDLSHCLDDASAPSGLNGWCYLDAQSAHPQGNAHLAALEKCPSGAQYAIRFTGEAALRPGTTAFLSCH